MEENNCQRLGTLTPKKALAVCEGSGDSELRLLCDRLCCRLFLLFELAHVQVVVKALFREQFVMFAALDDLAVPEDKDHVCIPDRGQAVSNDKRSATFQQLIERGQHDDLLAREGFYYSLYMSQFKKQEEVAAAVSV